MTAQVESSYSKRIGYQGVLLGGFATLAAALLVIGNFATHDSIEQRKAEDLLYSLGQVIPEDMHDNYLLDDRLLLQHDGKDVIVYRGLRDNKAVAVAFGLIQQGYSGEISLIMGVSRDGEILGVRIISHTETPGLGDRIEAEKDDWIYSFDGLSFDKLPEHKWAVRKDGGVFDQFSGATITPRAVVKAIKEGLILFNEQKSALLASKPVEPSTGDKVPDTASGEK